MRNQRRFVSFVVALVAMTGSAGTASAEVGKKVSVATGGSAVASVYPAMTDALVVAVPTGYKSKANFLKVTTTYQASCSSGDTMGSLVDVGGVSMVNASIPFEAFDEDAGNEMISKTYYLVPENQLGPAVPADSNVTLRLTSNAGNCSANYVTMVVEALK